MKKTLPFLLLLVLLLVVADQVTKWAVVLNFPFVWEMNYSPKVISVFETAVTQFRIVRVHNTGVAFGAGNGTTWAPLVFLGVQLVALVWLSLLYRGGFFATRLLKAAWVLILAGVIGNMTDRLVQGFFRPGAGQLSFMQNLTKGYVVDFLDFSFPWLPTEMWPMGYHWPSFNIADSCVCIAVALFLISGLFFTPKKEDKTPSGQV